MFAPRKLENMCIVAPGLAVPIFSHDGGHTMLEHELCSVLLSPGLSASVEDLHLPRLGDCEGDDPRVGSGQS